MAAVLAVAAVSSDSFAASSWSGNATDWVDCVKGAPAECVQRCIADTKGNVTSSGIWECLQNCHAESGVLNWWKLSLGKVSGAIGIGRLVPWGIRCFWDVPLCIVWGRDPVTAKYWGTTALIINSVLAVGSFGLTFASGTGVDWAGCIVGSVSSLWGAVQIGKDFEELLGYKCRSAQHKESMLRDVLAKMERSLGVNDANVDSGDQNNEGVDKEHLTSLEAELDKLGVIGEYTQRLDGVQSYLSAWTSRRRQ